ncbi:MAG TPA: sulfotransferase [Xanthobacteraceae bacterium]|nr:sulfotransferase [Xanthobacteraceae bacterium]
MTTIASTCSDAILGDVRVQWDRFAAACGLGGFDDGADFCKRQSRVILLLAASRSGGSWLAELCAASARVNSLPGEIDPFLLLALGAPDVARGQSDALDASRATAAVRTRMSHYLRAYAGHQWPAGQALTPPRRFRIAMRTLLQWPELHDRMDGVFDAVRAAFAAPNGGSREARMAAYLVRLKTLLPSLNAYFYDIDPQLIRARFPDERIPGGPPRESCVIEEPPFVCEAPWESSWTCAHDGAAIDRPLLLKSPSNAYRLDFLRALFPNAEITALHLIRDPVASVTGLMSGWLHHGFHKHRLPDGTLAIERYTRPDRPWTASWWKFDLPPGFGRTTHRPLEEVCAWQWRSANEHILHWVARNRADIHYVQTSTARLTADLNGEMARLFAELELEPDAGLLRAVARNRRTMLSYGVSDDARIKLRRLATGATADARVRDVLDAFADAGGGAALEIVATDANGDAKAVYR